MSNGPLCAGTKAGFEGVSKVAPIADAHGARIRAVYVLQIAGAASRHLLVQMRTVTVVSKFRGLFGATGLRRFVAVRAL